MKINNARPSLPASLPSCDNTDVINFLLPPDNWVGYHPQGASDKNGKTTSVPHFDILRDNGRAGNQQRIYFNPDTISLDYCRGREDLPILDNYIISWKQLHCQRLYPVTIEDGDREKYQEFAKCIREEIRDAATIMIELAYMGMCKQALDGVQGVITNLDFRALRFSSTKQARVLLAMKEKMSASTDDVSNVNTSGLNEEDIDRDLAKLYAFKYSVKPEVLAREFMEQNNVSVRVPLNRGKRYQDFISCIFGLKLNNLFKNSFMPMFTKHEQEKDKKDGSVKTRMKKKNGIGEVTATVNVYLSKTKSLVNKVKPEAEDATSGETMEEFKSNQCNMNAIEIFKEKVMSRVETYVDMSSVNDNASRMHCLDKKVFRNFLYMSDSQFTVWIEAFGKTEEGKLHGPDTTRENNIVIQGDSGTIPNAENCCITAENPVAQNKVNPGNQDDTTMEGTTHNPYLAWRARKIQSNHDKLRSLNLVSNHDQMRKELVGAWNLTESSPVVQEHHNWCDFATMTASEVLRNEGSDSSVSTANKPKRKKRSKESRKGMYI